MEQFDMQQQQGDDSNKVSKLTADPAFRLLRQQGNAQGAALMIYRVIMNIAVFFVAFAVTLVYVLEAAISGGLGNESDIYLTLDTVTQKAVDASGWGYLLAVLLGMVALLIWKKPGFVRAEIFQKGRPMGVGAFLALVCIVFGIQIPAQLWSMGLEWVCNQFGYSLLQLLEENALELDTVAMWLYVCLVAPIFEEILFRGLVLRSLLPQGKRLAVIASAVLFGLYHGSPVQTPYAIIVGLVLGYVAVEYNVVWAIVLHLMNNLLLSDTFPRLLGLLPEQLGEAVLWIFLCIFALIGVIVLILRWQPILRWRQEQQIEPWKNKAFWRAPCVVILSIWCLIDLVAYFLLMVLQ